jgi:hypothetical protein
MKNKYLLAGTVASAVLASVAILNPFSGSENGAYQSRSESALKRGAERGAKGYIEYMNMMKADPLTGLIDEDDLQRSRLNAQNHSRAGIIAWDEEGPSNMGGRTRAIHVDVNDPYRVFAGSVAGGLFVSNSRGNYWDKVQTFTENISISSICQTINGTVIVATGHSAEDRSGFGNTGSKGMGVYVYAGGDLSVAPVMIPGSDSWSYINEVIADTVNNVAWLLTSSGVWTYNTDNGTLTDVSATVGSNNSSAGTISKDGQVIVIANQSRNTMVSNDGGATFTNYTSGGSSPIPASQGRIEYSISHERSNGEYFVYAIQSSSGQSYFNGAYVSSTSGREWGVIAPSAGGPNGAFNPLGTQGYWNIIIGTPPNHPERAFIGGLDVYSWGASISNPTFGSWNKITEAYVPPTSSIYVHADQHEMKWDNMGRFYVGSDGGVGYSDDLGQSWVAANRGYNVTQFYSVAYSAHGDVLGGTQDNGSNYNDHTNFAWQDFTEITGGDGFDSDISHTNRNMMFSTLYYCGIFRSSDRGITMYPFHPNQLANGMSPGSSSNGPGNFNTVIRLHEVYDLNSTDSVKILPRQSYAAGSTIILSSNSSGDSISYVSTDTIRFEDTVFYDPNIFVYEYQVTDSITSANRDLGIEHPWVNLNSGLYPPLIGDSIILYNDPIDINDDDTIIVADTLKYRFYYATDPNFNDTLAMHVDSVLYGVAWDTIVAQDPYVSWLALAVGTGNWVTGQRDLGVWMSRYAKRFSDNIGDNEIWLNVLPNLGGGSAVCMEYSRNADFLYVGTSTGRLFRLTGYNDYYASTPGIVDSLQGWNLSIPAGNPTVCQSDMIWQAPGTFTPILGIGVDYSATSPNGDHLVVCLGNFSGSIQHAYEITNASTCGVGAANGTPILAAADNVNYPVYDAVIDRNDPNFVALATEYGVLVTQNVSAGTVVWENCSGDFGLTPVHALRQDWRTWDEGSKFPGKIYAGTHGRGIWSSGTLLSMPDDMNVGIDKEEFTTNLNIFPNPMTTTGFLRFDLENNSDVYINVYSISGKLIKNISRSNLPKGDNTIDFNVTELPIGTYIIEFRAGNQVETSKFVKAR